MKDIFQTVGITIGISLSREWTDSFSSKFNFSSISMLISIALVLGGLVLLRRFLESIPWNVMSEKNARISLAFLNIMCSFVASFLGTVTGLFIISLEETHIGGVQLLWILTIIAGFFTVYYFQLE